MVTRNIKIDRRYHIVRVDTGDSIEGLIKMNSERRINGSNPVEVVNILMPFELRGEELSLHNEKMFVKEIRHHQ